jgi:pimeloyl-ACP methyl ester carboxylesterase
MVRTSLTWRILGENLVGTCHAPTPARAGELSSAPSVGVLLVNAGSAPRSGNSDLSVQIGDRLALRGFPVFRFDLRGLGDSSGPTPVDVDSFRNEVLAGRNDEAVVALIERLQLELGLERVIVGGLCGAALPSVRALQAGRASPAGLILLEPNFRVPAQEESARPVRALLRSLSRRLGHKLPSDVNEPLVTLWLDGIARGVRSLVVVAGEEDTERYVARILESMPDRAPDAVACVRVPQTNHLFTRGRGRDGVLSAVERWMTENFSENAEPAVQAASGS